MPFLKPREQQKKLPRSRILENLAKREGLRHFIFNTLKDKYKGEWHEDFKSGQKRLC